MPVSSGIPVTRTRLPKSREYSAFSAKDFRACGHIHIAVDWPNLVWIVYTAGELKLTCLCATRFCITGYILIFVMTFVSRLCIDRTRGNTMKLAKTPVYSARDSNFFSNRVINIWNALPSLQRCQVSVRQ